MSHTNSNTFQYLRLCRFPTVFTALADISLGFLLAHTNLQPVGEFLWLLGASASLYLSGMVFNDVFDINQDSIERPNRPIPSGKVSSKSAIVFGMILMGNGVACAAMASMNSLYVALMLCTSILLYDRWMKRTVLGPLFMGSCRFLNIILGASSAATMFPAVFQNPHLWVGLCMGVYIAGVTLFAKREAKTNSRSPLLFALFVINVGLAGLVLWMTDITSRMGLFVVPGALLDPLPVLFLWGVITLTINRRALAAISNPIPEKIQPAIGSMLLSVIMLDAMLIYFKQGPPGIPYAVGTVCLIIPAVLGKRWIPLT